MKDNKVVEIKDIKKYFPLRSIGKKNAKYVKAVDGISLDVYEGETLGLVGESGSGKLAKMILGLLPPTESTVIIDGKDIWADKKNRGGGKEVSAVFQDPASSLNPRSTIYRTLERPLLINGYSKEEARERILDTVEKVNLRKELLDRFPNELSGGQQQRICIARAIAVQPEVILMDEPTSALDPVSTLKIEELMNTLKEKYTVAIVTHNMQQATRISDYTAFFLVGEMVEYAPTEELFSRPVDKRTEDYITGRFG